MRPKVEDILQRALQALNLKTLQELANAIGVSSNTISGWKARNSIGIVFEYLYPILLEKNISIYYVFFNLGSIKADNFAEDANSDIEKRVRALEEMVARIAQKSAEER